MDGTRPARARSAHPPPLLLGAVALLTWSCQEAAPGELCPAGAPGTVGEVRLAAPCASAHRPGGRSGDGARAPTPPFKELARLEAQGALLDVAAAWFLHGHYDQAAAYLGRAPPSLDRDSDLAATAYARGRLDDALRMLDELLERRPDHPQALWNRSLVLRRLELTSLAAESLERVAASREAGWSEAARARASALRQLDRDRARAWQAAQEAFLALVGSPAAALPLDQAARFPGTGRELFYEAVRAAPDRARALALLPLAEALDRAAGGGSSLRDSVHRVASADFARRAPLAAGYALLVQGKHPDPGALVGKLRASRERDILLGALLRSPAVARTPRELEELAQQSSDPWIQLDIQAELARLDALDGRSWIGDQRLMDGLKSCRMHRLSHQCLRLHLALSERDTAANRLARAEEHGRALMSGARALGEWDLERAALFRLAQVARFRFVTASARAYVQEMLPRAPGVPTVCSSVHRNLAALALQDLRPDDARREFDLALDCGAPMTLVGAWVLSELARMAPGPKDAFHFEKIFRQLSPHVETPGRRMLARYVRGRFQVLGDRPSGGALLREAIAAAEPLIETDADARDAWALAYKDLAFAAARAGDWTEVLAVTAQRLRVPVPARCALAAVVDAERTAVVARGASGEPRGVHDASRRTRLGRSLSGLVPQELLALLRGCERVEVLAASPLDSRSGLLPPEIAWSYRVGQERKRGPPGPARDLVVANVEAPASLKLPRLAPWNVPHALGSTSLLAGAAATPSRVLEGMAQATSIEIHAHGLLNPLLSGAPAIALSPEPDGRYALTAEAIRRVRLPGAPVVSLAACGAAWLPAYIHETFSLPQAFVAVGARAVLAATVDIPDPAGAFFAAVRARIQSGEEPALALRDERLIRLRSDPDARWVEDVLLFE